MKARIILLCLFGSILTGCSSNPVLTGKPQHWTGHTTEEMKAGLGPPSEIVPQGDGSEIWIYRKTGEFIAPGEERTNFRMGGGAGSGVFGASGGISTQRQSERVTDYENVWRFEVRNGRVRRWYAQRLEGGRVVWEDH